MPIECLFAAGVCLFVCSRRLFVCSRCLFACSVSVSLPKRRHRSAEACFCLDLPWTYSTHSDPTVPSDPSISLKPTVSMADTQRTAHLLQCGTTRCAVLCTLLWLCYRSQPSRHADKRISHAYVGAVHRHAMPVCGRSARPLLAQRSRHCGHSALNLQVTC